MHVGGRRAVHVAGQDDGHREQIKKRVHGDVGPDVSGPFVDVAQADAENK